MDMMVLMVTPACEEITHVLSESLDEPVPWYRRFYLKPHLLCCHWCSNYFKNIKVLREAMHRYADKIEAGDASHLPGLPADARARIIESLRKHDA